MKLPWKVSRDPFIRLSDLSRAAGSYTLPESDIRYAVTGDYADRARNHCACVCCVNLVLFFRALEERKSPAPAGRMTGKKDPAGMVPAGSCHAFRNSSCLRRIISSVRVR